MLRTFSRRSPSIKASPLALDGVEVSPTKRARICSGPPSRHYTAMEDALWWLVESGEALDRVDISNAERALRAEPALAAALHGHLTKVPQWSTAAQVECASLLLGRVVLTAAFVERVLDAVDAGVPGAPALVPRVVSGPLPVLSDRTVAVALRQQDALVLEPLTLLDQVRDSPHVVPLLHVWLARVAGPLLVPASREAPLRMLVNVTNGSPRNAVHLCSSPTFGARLRASESVCAVLTCSRSLDADAVAARLRHASRLCGPCAGSSNQLPPR